MPELIDVLDENGIKTGCVATREEVHRDGLWHRAIIVIIVCGDKVLMQRRSYNKEKNPDKWDISVAGHVSAGQNSTTAAMREVAEEVGIEIDKNESTRNFYYVFSYRAMENYRDGIMERQFYDVFVLHKSDLTLDQIKMQESEVQAVKLCTMSELRTLIEQHELVERDAVYAALQDYIFGI